MVETIEYGKTDDDHYCIGLFGSSGIYESLNVGACQRENKPYTVNKMDVCFYPNDKGDDGDIIKNGEACMLIYPRLQQYKVSVCNDFEELFSEPYLHSCFFVLLDLDDLPVELIELVLGYLFFIEVKPNQEIDDSSSSPKRQRIE